MMPIAFCRPRVWDIGYSGDRLSSSLAVGVRLQAARPPQSLLAVLTGSLMICSVLGRGSSICHMMLRNINNSLVRIRHISGGTLSKTSFSHYPLVLSCCFSSYCACCCCYSHYYYCCCCCCYNHHQHHHHYYCFSTPTPPTLTPTPPPTSVPTATDAAAATPTPALTPIPTPNSYSYSYS